MNTETKAEYYANKIINIFIYRLQSADNKQKDESKKISWQFVNLCQLTNLQLISSIRPKILNDCYLIILIFQGLMPMNLVINNKLIID